MVPGWQWKGDSHSHGPEDRVGEDHDREIDAKVIEKEAKNAFLLSVHSVILTLKSHQSDEYYC